MGFGILLEQQRRVFLAQLGDGSSELDLVLPVLRPPPPGDRPVSAFRCRHGRRQDLAVDSVSPVANGSSRASATVSPACAALRLICLSPQSAKMPPMRASRPPSPCSTAPSFSAPRSTRTSESLPPWPPCMVLSTCTTASPPPANAGTRRRRLDLRHVMAQRLEQPAHAIVGLGRADQHRHHQAFRQFAPEAAEHFVALRLDIAQQFFHQMLVIVGQLLQHLEAGFLLARIIGDIHHLAGRMGAIGKGALQRQIDKAGGDAVIPDRNLAQQQRPFAHLLQRGQQRRASEPRALSNLLMKRRWGMPASASRFRKGCSMVDLARRRARTPPPPHPCPAAHSAYRPEIRWSRDNPGR